MAQTTVRIDEKTRALLRELAEAEATSMQSVLTRALEAYRRKRFLEGVNAAYGALRQDQGAWQELTDERALWEMSIADGLPDDEGAWELDEASRAR